MALLHRVTDQRVVRLQIKNVELVDAGRDQQERLFIDLGSERFVLDQLKQLVFKNNRTFGRCHIASHLEQTLVRHGHMALLDVVQQVFQAFGDTFALGFNGFLLGLGIERQEITGRRGCCPLLHRKAHPGTGFLVRIYRIGQTHQGAGIKQVVGRRHGGSWI